MTSHLNSHRTTDIKPEMLSGVQTSNGTPHDKYNIRGIAHARTNRKDDIFMHRRLVQNFTYIMERGQGTCTLTKRTRRWTYSALRHFFPACCLLRFAAFFLNSWREMLISVQVGAGTGLRIRGLAISYSLSIAYPIKYNEVGAKQLNAEYYY